MVPFVDLYRQHKQLMPEIEQVVREILADSRFVLGRELKEFEESFARYVGCQHGVGVDSGYGALVVSLLALGIEPGDEVILPANTFYATAAAVRKVGARPVFVDVDEKTYNIDPECIAEAITEKTKAIMPVHLYGLSVDFDSIKKVIGKKNIRIIEDACQAHGAKYKGKNVGSFGDTGCFSFYPAKNLGSIGEGGMVVTDQPDIADFISAYRNCGQTKKYYHDILGENRRLHNLQAAILNIKLKHVDEWNRERREAARIYKVRLEESGLEDLVPYEPEGFYHVFHLYVIRVKKRDRLLERLKENEIGAGIHYPIPIHLLSSMADLGYKEGDFPVTERLAGEILSLPMFPGITEDEIGQVVKAIAEFKGV